MSLGKRFKVNLGVHDSHPSVEGARVGISEEAVNNAEPFRDVPPQERTELEKSQPSHNGRHLMQVIAGRFVLKLHNKNDAADSSQEASFTSTDVDSSDTSNSVTEDESSTNEPSQSVGFEKGLEVMESEGTEIEMPGNLRGILLQESYMMAPKSLNALLFAPESKFLKDLAERQGTAERRVGKWTWSSKAFPSIRRELTYIKAATKLVKAVEGFEEQVYLKADGRQYAALCSISTLGVPYGNCFKVEVLYRITPGPNLHSREETSCLAVSWNVKFIH